MNSASTSSLACLLWQMSPLLQSELYKQLPSPRTHGFPWLHSPEALATGRVQNPSILLSLAALSISNPGINPPVELLLVQTRGPLQSSSFSQPG